MPGFFDALANGFESPLFLGGAALATGGGVQGLTSGLKAGAGLQDRRRQMAEEDQRKMQFEGLLAGGFDGAPNGVQQIARMAGPERGLEILAQYADPMKRQKEDAALAYTRAQTDKLRREPVGGEAPSSVREYEYFNRLPDDQKQRYLTMKRAEKYLDTGTEFVRPNPVRPGENVQTIPKNVAGEEQQKIVGRETGERQMAQPKAMASLESANSKTQLVRSKIAQALPMINNYTTGVGSLLSALPGTQARDLKETIDTIVANLGFEELQDMRNNSPTGGALGAIAVQELNMLQKTKTSLEQAQTVGQLTNAMRELDEFQAGAAERRKRAFDMTYGSQQPPPQMTPQAQAPLQNAPQAPAAARPRAVNPQTGQTVEFDGQQWIEVR